MHSNLVRAFIIGIIAVGAPAMVQAQQNGAPGESADMGKYEYDGHCAACHGLTGKGDGFYVELLKGGTKVPNLTELSKKNNGVFPFTRVYETIDGRQEVKAHGTREMPIWGKNFSARTIILRPYYDDEAFVRGRILAVTEYIYRLQAK